MRRQYDHGGHDDTKYRSRVRWSVRSGIGNRNKNESDVRYICLGDSDAVYDLAHRFKSGGKREQSAGRVDSVRL